MMKFEITHEPDVVGQKIFIKIVTDANRYITSVTTTLDGFRLATDVPAANSTKFDRHFRQAGGYSPGNVHKLIVETTDNNGSIENATSIWVDD